MQTALIGGGLYLLPLLKHARAITALVRDRCPSTSATSKKTRHSRGGKLNVLDASVTESTSRRRALSGRRMEGGPWLGKA